MVITNLADVCTDPHIHPLMMEFTLDFCGLLYVGFKVTLGCTARSKMLPRLCKKACMPSFSVSKPQDKINMLDEYIRGHDITLWYLLYRLETRMPQRVHNRTVFTNVDLYIGQALEKYKPYSTIMPDVSVTVFDFHKDTKRTAWVWNGSRNWNICYSVCILV